MPSRPIEVNLYYDDANKVLQGIRFNFFVGENIAPAAVQSGPVEQVGQLKYKHEFKADDLFQFFGFKTENDDASGLSKITKTQIVTYEVAKFKSTKDTVRTIDATIVQTGLNIKAA